MRLGLETGPWLEARRRAAERTALRRDYEARVQSGEWPTHETLVPLFPYQREGMLHLAFTERALLADEMGLGKTIQAIAACALLQRLGCARRVLVVTPASLKTEWEEQIRRFTALSLRIVYGGRLVRLACYNPTDAPFFTLVNYEQVVPDTLEINSRLQPDIVVLDEAQRIKNWTTKTAQAIKRLRSRADRRSRCVGPRSIARDGIGPRSFPPLGGTDRLSRLCSLPVVRARAGAQQLCFRRRARSAGSRLDRPDCRG